MLNLVANLREEADRETDALLDAIEGLYKWNATEDVRQIRALEISSIAGRVRAIRKLMGFPKTSKAQTTETLEPALESRHDRT